jgi:phosphoribosylglycinamide formyltransferase-1
VVKSHLSKQIAVFASGSGSNAENIYHYFQNSVEVEFKFLVCNNPNSRVLQRFESLNVETILITKEELASDVFINKLYGVDLIILAGFLALIPESLLAAFPKKIINIHPALLPKYGGKGMYGDRVHKAILANNEKEHGISIHYVNEEFDKGEIIFQKKFPLTEEDHLISIQSKIHDLEFKYYPETIEKLLLNC